MSAKKIKGKVIRIISPLSVIVNIGLKDGITTGTDLVIYEEGQDIQEPDGKSLGKIEFVKARLRVTHAQENFSIAESAEREDMTTISGSIATSLSFKKSLLVNEKQIEPLTAFDKTVKKGDFVRAI